jgi:hypothetical protein
MRIVWIAALLLAGLLALDGAARADVLLTPGSTVALPGADYTAGVTQLATGTFSFSNGRIAGTVTETVFREAGGTVDFLYQTTNTGSMAFSLASTAGANYSGFQTIVDSATNSASIPTFTAGTVPAFAATRGANGSIVSFAFGTSSSNPGLPPGATSNVLFIKTDATAFDAFGTITVGGLTPPGGPNPGSASVNNTFEPSLTVIPEPGSMTLAGAGLFLLGGLGLRRFRRC